MAGKIKVDQIETVAGTGTITLNNDVAMAATKTLPAASLTGTLPANIIDSDNYVDGSIDNEHLADDAVGIAELSATGTASSSTFLRGDNSWVAPGGGKVLQVVTNHDNTEKDLATGTTMTNYSELNTSITPSATNSKILVMVHFGALQYGGNDSSLGYGKVMYQISGGSVQDMAGSEQLGANNMSAGGKHQFSINLETSEWQTFQPSMVLLHEPNTTTSTSYQAFFQAESSNGILKINKNYRNGGNDPSTISTMTLMEIGA